jgi:hypothetical protein
VLKEEEEEEGEEVEKEVAEEEKEVAEEEKEVAEEEKEGEEVEIEAEAEEEVLNIDQEPQYNKTLMEMKLLLMMLDAKDSLSEENQDKMIPIHLIEEMELVEEEEEEEELQKKVMEEVTGVLIEML